MAWSGPDAIWRRIAEAGTELYAVIGHSPRHLDRNVTLNRACRPGHGVNLVLARGPAPLGLYEKAEQRVPIKSIRMAADVPVSERSQLELFRTDTPAFQR